MTPSVRIAIKGVVAAALAAPALGVSPALAGVTNVTWPVTINVIAAAGTENEVEITYQEQGGSWSHYIADSAGVHTVVTDAPTCYPRGPKAVSCPDGTSGDDGTKGQGESFTVLLRDGDDSFKASSVGDFEVHGGSGDDLVIGTAEASVVPATETDPETVYYTEDMLYGGGGNDDLLGREGPDYLAGGGGDDLLLGGAQAPRDDFATGGVDDDRMLGGGGNDVLRADFGDRDLLIDCGRGRHDRAVIDRIDPRPKGCEKVRRVSAQ